MAAGYYAPRRQRVESFLEALIAVDTSGSVSDAALNAFLNEIVGITRTTPNLRVLVVCFDAQGYSPLPGGKPFLIDSTNASRISKTLSSAKFNRGGTILSSVTTYLEDNKKALPPDYRPELMITFTDGEYESGAQFPPSLPKDKRMFLIDVYGTTGINAMVSRSSNAFKDGKYVYPVKVGQ
jgi:predicted metal-dependent peptidase